MAAKAISGVGQNLCRLLLTTTISYHQCTLNRLCTGQFSLKKEKAVLDVYLCLNCLLCRIYMYSHVNFICA